MVLDDEVSLKNHRVHQKNQQQEIQSNEMSIKADPISCDASKSGDLPIPSSFPVFDCSWRDNTQKELLNIQWRDNTQKELLNIQSKIDQLLQSNNDQKLFFTKEFQELQLTTASLRSTIKCLVEQNKVVEESCDRMQEIVHSVRSQSTPSGQGRKNIQSRLEKSSPTHSVLQSAKTSVPLPKGKVPDAKVQAQGSGKKTNTSAVSNTKQKVASTTIDAENNGRPPTMDKEPPMFTKYYEGLGLCHSNNMFEYRSRLYDSLKQTKKFSDPAAYKLYVYRGLLGSNGYFCLKAGQSLHNAFSTTLRAIAKSASNGLFHSHFQIDPVPRPRWPLKPLQVELREEKANIRNSQHIDEYGRRKGHSISSSASQAGRTKGDTPKGRGGGASRADSSSISQEVDSPNSSISSNSHEVTSLRSSVSNTKEATSNSAELSRVPDTRQIQKDSRRLGSRSYPISLPFSQLEFCRKYGRLDRESDEIHFDEQMLSDALKSQGRSANSFNIFPVIGDGRCGPRSIARLLLGDEHRHREIAQRVLTYCQKYPQDVNNALQHIRRMLLEPLSIQEVREHLRSDTHQMTFSLLFIYAMALQCNFHVVNYATGEGLVFASAKLTDFFTADVHENGYPTFTLAHRMENTVPRLDNNFSLIFAESDTEKSNPLKIMDGHYWAVRFDEDVDKIRKWKGSKNELRGVTRA